MVGKMRVTCPDCHGEGSRLRDKEKSVGLVVPKNKLMLGARNAKGIKSSKTRKGWNSRSDLERRMARE